MSQRLLDMERGIREILAFADVLLMMGASDRELKRSTIHLIGRGLEERGEHLLIQWQAAVAAARAAKAP